ncbi:protein D3-like [Contarinia nasturtii]|uniref:protein D3-like n=1 Tax=Contarinia nasturtii TaxID=265458 RepID=UPI0012D3B2B1|nr:protein D3-like [Contarinia nasturtii]XP_031633573.1 protein D3-like [Contarinia nasturtii]
MAFMKKMFLPVTIWYMMTIYCNCDMSSDLEKSFIENEIIPDTLKTAPKKILSVSYGSDAIVNLGNELKPTQTKERPTVTWEVEKGAFYTLIKVDPDAPSRVNPAYRDIRHWLIMNIPESDVANGDEIIEYIGAGPPKDTGLHRYIFLVFKQPNGKIEHNELRATKRQMNNRPKTSVTEFMKKYNLNEPNFGNFYQAQYDEYSDVLHAQLMG